jgi:hypothetical protein
MEATDSSESLVITNQIIRQYILEAQSFNIHCCKQAQTRGLVSLAATQNTNL